MASPLPARAPIRVLVVDDSPFMRHAIERLITAMPNAAIIGNASDGFEAVRKALELRPDVITMDVEMPRMNGLAAVREIMTALPTPIVMLSTLTRDGAETSLQALEAGAVEVVAKPSGLSQDIVNVGERLAQAITHASEAQVARRRPPAIAALPPRPPGSPRPTGVASQHIIVIGSSTGGPPALTAVIPHLPADLAAGVVVVQHMPPGFTAALARRLDALSPLSVTEAQEGDVVAAGRVLIAPGDFHLMVGPDRRVRLDRGPSVHGVRPSIDITLQSVTSVYGSHASVAILTGMGKDGAEGCAAIERIGGQIFTQDEETCVVYGMPRVAKERTAHAVEAPLHAIAPLLVRSVPARRAVP